MVQGYCLCWYTRKRKHFSDSYAISHFTYEGTAVAFCGGKYLGCE